MTFDCALYMSVYRHSPVGLVIVDGNTDLVEVNGYMLRLFGLDGVSYQGRKFGNVFGCAELPLDTICGEGRACGECELRAVITAALERKAQLTDIAVGHRFDIGGVVEMKWFKLSANAVDVKGRRHAAVSFVDITREKQYEDILVRTLTYDKANGVLDKCSLLNVLKGLSESMAGDVALSVCLADIDDLKDINDRFGHYAGDRVLNDFTGIARHTLRTGDLIGRYDGGEFLFVLPGTDIGSSAKALRRIQAALDEKLDLPARVTFSAGFAQLGVEELKRMRAEDIIGLAEGRLQAAKRAGKMRLATSEAIFELV